MQSNREIRAYMLCKLRCRFTTTNYWRFLIGWVASWWRFVTLGGISRSFSLKLFYDVVPATNHYYFSPLKQDTLGKPYLLFCLEPQPGISKALSWTCTFSRWVASNRALSILSTLASLEYRTDLLCSSALCGGYGKFPNYQYIIRVVISIISITIHHNQKLYNLNEQFNMRYILCSSWFFYQQPISVLVTAGRCFSTLVRLDWWLERMSQVAIRLPSRKHLNLLPGGACYTKFEVPRGVSITKVFSMMCMVATSTRKASMLEFYANGFYMKLFGWDPNLVYSYVTNGYNRLKMPWDLTLWK